MGRYGVSPIGTLRAPERGETLSVMGRVGVRIMPVLECSVPGFDAEEVPWAIDPFERLSAEVAKRVLTTEG